LILGSTKSRGSTLKALILAAGESTRMRPLTANKPKPLLPVAGKPFLEHSINNLKKNGIKDIVLLIGWRSERLQEYFGTGKKLGINIEYVHQTARYGTAHAIGTARKNFSDTFLCMNGDILVTNELVKGLLEFYKKNKSTVMSLAKVPDPTGLGIVQVEKNKVKRIIEKPKKHVGNLVNAGVYIFQQKIFDAVDETPISPRGEYEITDALEILKSQFSQTVFGYQLKTPWLDIAMPWHLLNANELLMKSIKSKISGTVEKYTTFSGPVQIGKNTMVRNGSYIMGPVIIGENCDIGPNCYIRGSTSIGNNCKIGAAVELKNSIVMDHSNIPHHNYVGDSIIGEHCNLGSGTKVANLRLDNKNIYTTVKGERIETGRRKLGVIMGDNVKTGVNSVINIGTVIGENALIGPGAVASGGIAPNSIVY
jgi:bifunctional UDP-N-acetylglucosamine pyrophosphorylase/glucosamine-1-phosphate N-acetyltransferase